jgi:thiol-disulfide isomerase/thioredoxin
MVRLVVSLVGGAAACAVTFLLVILTDTGTDLAATLHWAAALSFAAGLAVGGHAPRRAWTYGAAVALGNVAPIVVLSWTGVALTGALWSISAIATGVLMVAAGVLVRRSWTVGRSRHALAALAGAATVLLSGTFILVPFVLRAISIERSSRPIPPVTMSSCDGAAIASSAWTGRVTVLSFWATWCAPCRAELPELRALHERYRDDPRVEFLAVNPGRGGDTPAAALEFMRAHASDLPCAFAGEQVADALGVGALPSLMLVDPRGQLRLTHHGYDESEPLADIIAEEIDGLLAER